MKLLNKSIKPFAVFSVFIVLTSIPVYYFVIQKIYLKDADESLFIKKIKIQDRINELSANKNDAQEIILLLNALEIGLSIQKVDNGVSQNDDQIYTVARFDAYHDHVEPFRVMESSIRIHGKPYFLKIETDLDEFNDVLPYTATVAGLFFLFILSGYYLVNKRVSEKIWSPFLDTIQSLEHFSISSNASMPVIKSDIEEFQKLSKILQTYTQNNRTIFLQQREFIENASHELQTPLMILQAKTDALMQTSELNENQFALTDEIKQITGRMAKINKNLLLLVKIENKQFDNREKLNLKNLLEREVTFFFDLATNKEIAIEKEYENDLIIEANKPLFEILINNLLRNAINYNTNQGKIKVLANAEGFIISNTSSLEELDAIKVFQRFYKTGSSSSNTGLGLAICKEICTIHGWEIGYSYDDGLHNFSVRI